MLALGEDIGKHECKVGHAGHDDERSNECVESSAATDVHNSKERVEYGAHDCCVEGVAPFLVNLADPGGERCRVVTTEGPEHTAGGDVAANVCGDGGQEDDDDETEGSGVRVCGLAVDFGEGEGPGGFEEGVEVVH